MLLIFNQEILQPSYDSASSSWWIISIIKHTLLPEQHGLMFNHHQRDQGVTLITPMGTFQECPVPQGGLSSQLLSDKQNYAT